MTGVDSQQFVICSEVDENSTQIFKGKSDLNNIVYKV